MEMKTIDGKQVFSEYLGDVEIRHVLDNITNTNTNYLSKSRLEMKDGAPTGVIWQEAHSLYRLPHGTYTVSVEEDTEGNILELSLTYEADARSAGRS
jgi:hypothetical protein